MSYRFEYTGEFSRAELERAELTREFDTQQAAEEWLTIYFTDLVRLGVSEVTLFEEDRPVFGPMSLLP